MSVAVKFLSIFGFLLILSLSTETVSARSLQTSTIKGKVVADIPDQRKVLRGVNVTLTSPLLGARKLQTLSDDEGVYTFTGLNAGDYVLSVELQGFVKYEQKLSVQIGATLE